MARLLELQMTSQEPLSMAKLAQVKLAPELRELNRQVLPWEQLSHQEAQKLALQLA